MLSQYLPTLLATALGVAATWGAMRVTIKILKGELDEVKRVIPDFAALKVQVCSLSEELSRLRTTVEGTREALNLVRIETATKTRKRRA